MFLCYLIVLRCIYITKIFTVIFLKQEMSTVDDLRQNVLSKNVFSLFTFMITLYIKYIYIYNIIYIYILSQYIYIYIYIYCWLRGYSIQNDWYYLLHARQSLVNIFTYKSKMILQVIKTYSKNKHTSKSIITIILYSV